MPCFSPIQAYRGPDGGVYFPGSKRPSADRNAELLIPCGRCLGCMVQRSQDWTVRCVHEASCWNANSFVTLTYDDEHLPFRGDLVHRDWQLFHKRLLSHARRVARKAGVPFLGIPFYMCGQYVPDTGRPHFHGLLFGFQFADLVRWKRNASGQWIYRSALLERLWPNGFSTVGEVSADSAAYVARYCHVRTGPDFRKVYERIDSETGEIYRVRDEYARMSTRPAVAKAWFVANYSDVFPRDRVLLDGRFVKPPRVYLRWLRSLDPGLYAQVTADRGEVLAEPPSPHDSAARLEVRERVLRAKFNNFKKGTL